MSRNMKSGSFIAVDSCRGVPNLARLVSVTAKVFQNLMLDSARRCLLAVKLIIMPLCYAVDVGV